MCGRVEEDEPLWRRHAGAKRFVIVQRPFHSLVVENHPCIERRRHAEQRRARAQLIVEGVRVAACFGGEEVDRNWSFLMILLRGPQWNAEGCSRAKSRECG